MPEVAVGRHRIGPRLHGVGGDPDIVVGMGRPFARKDAAILEYRSAVVSPTGTTVTQGLSRKARIARALLL